MSGLMADRSLHGIRAGELRSLAIGESHFDILVTLDDDALDRGSCYRCQFP